MTNQELTAIKCRMGSLSPRRLQDIRALSEACYRLVTVDLPALMLKVEELDLVCKTLASEVASYRDTVEIIDAEVN